MGLRESLRPIADAVRGITGPSGLGVRTNQLTIRTRTWAGGRPGAAGSAVHLYPIAQRIAVPLSSSVLLVNALAATYAAHVGDTQAHQVADNTDAITAPAATDPASAITLANNIKAVWNAHVANATVHYNADGSHAVTAPDASGTPSLLVLLTAEKAMFNLHFGASAVSDSDLVLPMQYRIRQIAQREIAESGGRYENGDIVVEHITPFDGISVGYTVAQLKPPITTDAIERLYIVSTDDPAGGHAGEYDLRELASWRPFSFELVLKRRESTP